MENIKKTVLIISLLVFCTGSVFSQEKWNPKANPESVITVGNARFTVLAKDMVRMEWDSTGQFTDNASLCMVNRYLPVPEFKKHETSHKLIIETACFKLIYKKNKGRFSPDNLEVLFGNRKDKNVWYPGQENKGNLKGTYRTLDGCKGNIMRDGKPLPLEDGLLSTEGWTCINDSHSYLLDDSDWNWVIPRKNKNAQDLYFICYGKDYKKALYDFTLIAGKVPIPPKYAFGYWWSRYWNYSDDELRDLVDNFHYYHIPLDVLVVDMDWHKTKGLDKQDEFGQTAGWTGYTWEKSLFPQPGSFLKWVRGQNLNVTFNLHPASGIPSDESQYPEFAKRMNFDTTGHKPIPFEAADKRYMTTLFDVIMHPMQKAGVSFWWLDWQQWPYSKKYDNLSNTWWLNYCFFTDMERQGVQRPMLYHRWGGLGNHRYEIGFSGDVVIDWTSLAYQPYFTSTASNVLYGYWSHDLGGHYFDNSVKHTGIDPELYVRWMQFGALSPIFRTHSSKDARIKKEVWNLPYEESRILANTIRFRYSLVPYIYTMAKKDYDTGISLCRPMYYDYPDSAQSYDMKDEYMFGDDLLVSPVTTPAINDFSNVKVWLPGGNDWYEWSTGTLLNGGQMITRKFLLSEYPLYVKAGSVIPMYGNDVDNLEYPVKNLVIGVFPGKNDSGFSLYEDSGNDEGYKKGEYGITRINKTITDNGIVKVEIMPRKGTYPGMLDRRNMEIRFYGAYMPEKVSVNGKVVPFDSTGGSGNKACWKYSGGTLTAHVYLSDVSCGDKADVEVKFVSTDSDINGVPGKMIRLKKSTSYLKNHWNKWDALPAVISLTNQTDILINYHPEEFNDLINSFNKNYLLIPDTIKTTPASAPAIEKCINLIK